MEFRVNTHLYLPVRWLLFTSADCGATAARFVYTIADLKGDPRKQLFFKEESCREAA